MKIFGETNETKDRAKEQGLPTGYLDAKPDIEAAIDYCFTLNKNKPIILLGSSYSASLALLISANTAKKLKEVIVFSPGEYLKGINLANEIKKIQIPVFATSPKKEIKQVSDVLRFVKKKYISHFKPEVEGFHGSKTIWESVEGYKTYWNKIKSFLRKID